MSRQAIKGREAREQRARQASTGMLPASACLSQAMSPPSPNSSRPLALEFASARGEVYVTLEAEERALIESVARNEVVPDATPLKEPRVWRRAAWVFKFYPRSHVLARCLRAGPALRSARAHAAILPIASPAPIAALELTGRARHFGGLLISRFIEGRALDTVWADGSEGRLELAQFLSSMFAHGVRHCDLHPGNLLWDGKAWWLIDLDSLRPNVCGIGTSRYERASWARLFFNLRLDPEFAAVHRLAMCASGRESQVAGNWRAIEQSAHAIKRARGDFQWHAPR